MGPSSSPCHSHHPVPPTLVPRRTMVADAFMRSNGLRLRGLYAAAVVLAVVVLAIPALCAALDCSWSRAILAVLPEERGVILPLVLLIHEDSASPPPLPCFFTAADWVAPLGASFDTFLLARRVKDWPGPFPMFLLASVFGGSAILPTNDCLEGNGALGATGLFPLRLALLGGPPRDKSDRADRLDSRLTLLFMELVRESPADPGGGAGRFDPLPDFIMEAMLALLTRPWLDCFLTPRPLTGGAGFWE